MKIGVMSDTHGEVAQTRQALDILDRLQVELIIHCGDIGSEVVTLLKGRPIHFVAGNMDDPDALRQAITDGKHTLHAELGTLVIEGCRVAFLHGHDVRLLHNTIHSGHWDLVCHGHTHAFSSGRMGSTMVVNPGALARTLSPSVAVVDLPSMEVTEILL
jgi:putative phosphoesterase